MKKSLSKYLVVDASIARASGGVEAVHPTSTSARDFLQAVLTICHKAVMTLAIRDEWNTHQSKFARTWRRSMVARGKILLADIDERPDIRQKIKQSLSTNNQKDAMQKDCHLLESAIATDYRIASLDNIARDLFKSELNDQDVNNVMWVNPVVDADQILDWLDEGAPDRPEYKLLR